jgi:NAD(P)-dependent dehydrogenase (short-subunit alcohol dehydrogenase family)
MVENESPANGRCGPFSDRLSRKTALVTGASSGIGEAAAKALAAQGANVVLAARRQEELDRVAGEIGETGGTAIAVRSDLELDEDAAAAVRAAEEHFGGLDVAFNSTGRRTAYGPVADVTPEEWRADIDALLTSVFLAMRHEVPAMLRRGGGTVINNSSVLGVVGTAGEISSYVAAKHGVNGLTRAAALELAPRNVRVNAVALGTVDTPLFRSGMVEHQSLVARLRAAHPLGRIGTPDEAASLVAYLAGDEAGFITGAVLTMDGGWSAQ